MRPLFLMPGYHAALPEAPSGVSRSGGATCPARIATSSRRLGFEPTSKRRRGFPSETNVKRGDRVVHGEKELLPPRSSAGRTRVRVDPDADTPPAASSVAGFDGDRDYFAR
jgi:hypothetical protein